MQHLKRVYIKLKQKEKLLNIQKKKKLKKN